LRFEEQPLSIISLMARDPQLFADVLSHVFRGNNTALAEVITDEMKARTRASSGLLRMFKKVPGLNGTKVDSEALADWVSQVRDIAAPKDLTEICDIHIGQLLANVPDDPDETFWPPSAVCEVIEGTASRDLERGLSTGCFKKRGVYSKAINEGGDQERCHAEKNQQWADNTYLYPRTSATLASIADSWLHRAAEGTPEQSKER
jgi:hypothetical protein